MAGIDLSAGDSDVPVTRPADMGRHVVVNDCLIGGRLSLGTDGITKAAIDGALRGGDPTSGAYRNILGQQRGIGRDDVENHEVLLPETGHAPIELARSRKAWLAMDAQCQACIPGTLDLSNNKVGGGLEISHVYVGGEIRLDDTSVGRDLRASRHGLGRREWESQEPLYRTQCTRVRMQNLVCGGDADLTGVALHQADESIDGPRENGRGIFAAYASIKGDLSLWPTDGVSSGNGAATEPEPAVDSRLEGADLRVKGAVLNLRAAAIGRLLVSGDNFDDLGELRSQKKYPRVNLENAKLDRLEIRRPVPAMIKLSGIVVTEWDLAPDDTYLRVLENTNDFFSGDVYTQIEQSLRNDGKNDLADKVYIQMRKGLEDKMWAEGENVRWFLSKMHRALTNYGTSALRPFCYIAAIIAFNSLLFSRAENVVASTAYLEAIAGDEVTAARAEARAGLEARGETDIPLVVDLSPADLAHPWSVGDVMAITTRFSVPLITLAMSDRWEPSRRAAIIRCPASLIRKEADPRCSLGIRVVTITRLLGYLSWIFWPLFIIRVSGVINRRG